MVCMTEPPVTPDHGIENNIPVWQDFTETDNQPAIDRARELVLGGQSVFLQGFGGTGRTCTAKDIARRSDRVGNDYVYPCSSPNMAVEG